MATYYFRNSSGGWGTASQWSLTSGGPANGAVPTSADNAILDANSGVCTMSVAGVCASINCSAYTSTLTMTNGLTVSGNVTLGSGMTITGTNTLSINATATLTSNGKTWPNSITSTGAITFADAWTIGGNFTTSQTVTLNGNLNLTGNWVSNNSLITVNGSAYTATISGGIRYGSGTISTTFNPTVVLNGTGTIGNTTGGVLTFSNLTINTSGTITIDNLYTQRFYALNPGVSTFNYSAGTVVATSTTVQLGAFVFNSGFSNIVWNNIFMDNNITTATWTYNSNVYVNGTLQFGASGTQTQNHNGAYKIYVGSPTGNIGILTHTGGNCVFNGTMTVEFTGTGGTGTWVATTNGAFNLNVNFNTSGTLTLSNTLVYGGTMTYISGRIICDSTSILYIGTCTLNTAGMTWNQLTLAGGTSTITLTSNLYCNSVLCGNSGTMAMTINGPYTLYIGYNGNVGTFTNGPVGGASFINGTATIEIGGQGGIGYMNCTGVRNLQIQINFNFNFKGTLIIQDAIAPPNLNVVNNPLVTQTLTWLTFNGGSNTYTYKSGNIITKNVYNGLGSTLVCGNGTFINFDKIPFGYVLFISNTTTTFNRFFNGSPKVITQIGTTDPTVATANYTVQFQDGFEKISNFVKINNCTMSKPLQLLVLNPKGNKGNNVGIRYINQVPNGIARKTPIIPNNLTGSEITPMTGGLLADPATGL
jgi:hypothetical protein